MTINVTIWNEYRHEKVHEEARKVYPNGLHAPIADHLRAEGMTVRLATLDESEHGLTEAVLGDTDVLTWWGHMAHHVRLATLDESEHGLTEAVLGDTDVLTWWGHMAHHEVSDEIVARVRQRVLEGMGLIVLHSAHFSKVFRSLMGSSCDLIWREANERERIWVIEPGHPIAAGLGSYFEIEREEMYGERFDIPAPETLVFVSWFQGGEVFRSGCCYQRGLGRIFYFRPGHETYPTYYQKEVLQVIANAVKWAAPVSTPQVTFGNRPALEKF